jgi:flagellum-specific peptidoglycan hydrolase FlgJ
MYGVATYNSSKKFAKEYAPGIIEAIRGTKLFLPAVLAQSALESGYGKRIPKDSNNFAGIKYNPNIPGVVGFVMGDTIEYTKSGKPYRTVQKFSKFKDVESGFRAHIKVLLLPRYKDAREKAKSPEEQILMIGKAGYVTQTPQSYLNLMKSIIAAMRDITQLGRIG